MASNVNSPTAQTLENDLARIIQSSTSPLPDPLLDPSLEPQTLYNELQSRLQHSHPIASTSSTLINPMLDLALDFHLTPPIPHLKSPIASTSSSFPQLMNDTPQASLILIIHRANTSYYHKFAKLFLRLNFIDIVYKFCYE